MGGPETDTTHTLSYDKAAHRAGAVAAAPARLATGLRGRGRRAAPANRRLPRRRPRRSGALRRLLPRLLLPRARRRAHLRPGLPHPSLLPQRRPSLLRGAVRFGLAVVRQQPPVDDGALPGTALVHRRRACPSAAGTRNPDRVRLPLRRLPSPAAAGVRKRQGDLPVPRRGGLADPPGEGLRPGAGRPGRKRAEQDRGAAPETRGGAHTRPEVPPDPTTSRTGTTPPSPRSGCCSATSASSASPWRRRTASTTSSQKECGTTGSGGRDRRATTSTP